MSIMDNRSVKNTRFFYAILVVMSLVISQIICSSAAADELTLWGIKSEQELGANTKSHNSKDSRFFMINATDRLLSIFFENDSDTVDKRLLAESQEVGESQ